MRLLRFCAIVSAPLRWTAFRPSSSSTSSAICTCQNLQTCARCPWNSMPALRGTFSGGKCTTRGLPGIPGPSRLQGPKPGAAPRAQAQNRWPLAAAAVSRAFSLPTSLLLLGSPPPEQPKSQTESRPLTTGAKSLAAAEAPAAAAAAGALPSGASLCTRSGCLRAETSRPGITGVFWTLGLAIAWRWRGGESSDSKRSTCTRASRGGRQLWWTRRRTCPSQGRTTTAASPRGSSSAQGTRSTTRGGSADGMSGWPARGCAGPGSPTTPPSSRSTTRLRFGAAGTTCRGRGSRPKCERSRPEGSTWARC
mmetsp:Transcript_9680/g.22104  ORF Transcript_9680/g.22104 Transcript_9680/m.22104 type:complete len:308 (+) Transcript_9680:201-1124(+)